MKVEELRIGNYVRHHGPIMKLNIHDLYRFHDNYIKLEPVELTEEYLIELGFKKLDHYSFVKKGTFIYKRKRGFIYGSREREVNIKSVHQLQNLFFSLTGTEIQFKPQIHSCAVGAF